MLLREQGITIFLILTTLSMTISTILIAVTGVFGGSGGTGVSASTPKDEGGVLKKWLDRLANALERLAGKAVEARSHPSLTVVVACTMHVRGNPMLGPLHDTCGYNSTQISLESVIYGEFLVKRYLKTTLIR